MPDKEVQHNCILADNAEKNTRMVYIAGFNTYNTELAIPA